MNACHELGHTVAATGSGLVDYVHVLYVTTVGLCEMYIHTVNLAAGVVVAWLGMNTARIALETARVNEAAVRPGAPEAVATMQAPAQSLSRPEPSAETLSRPKPMPTASSRPVER